MATSARLDELKKKFDENPRRYFAPLANEYRKLGDLTQAIAICRAHLPNQVGHISGHIVLAQALYEARELGEGRQVFEAALELDPENLIALRFLGDIAREQGDPETARNWYERVLEADPRNEEISQLLKDLSQAPASAVAEEDPATAASSSYADESFAPTGYGTVAAETHHADLVADHGASFDGSELESVDSAAGASYELPTQGEDPFNSVPQSGHAQAPEETFVIEPTHYDGGLSLGDLEAIAEPSLDDWFAPSELETSHSEHPTPAFTESFFPEIDSHGKPSRESGPDLSAIAESLKSSHPFEDAFAPSGRSQSDAMPAVSSEDVTPPYVPVVDAFAADTDLRSGESDGSSIPPRNDADSAWQWSLDANLASADFDSADSSTVSSDDERPTLDATDEAIHDANSRQQFVYEALGEESFEPFAAISSNPMDDPFVVLSDDDTGDTVSWEPDDVVPLEGLLSMEAGAAPIGADPRIDAVDGLYSDDLNDAQSLSEEQDEAGEPHHSQEPRFFADPIFGRTPMLEALEPEPTPAAFVTETMAELYLQQGFTQEALEIYRQLLSRSPKDELLRERVAALESGSASTMAPSEDPLPQPDRDGQSIRAFFARFARRQPSRRPPPPSGSDHDEGEGADAASPSSDAPFAEEWSGERYGGAATRDEALTVPDRALPGSPSLSQLFAGAPTSRDDETAATALASVFSADLDDSGGTTSGSQASPSDEKELSLEHLFRDVPVRSSGAVTLDEFYASSTTSVSGPTPDHAEETGERDADIEQFTAWLEGLKKK